MTELQFGDQAIRHDRDATVAVYQRMQGGWAEECGCLFCKNFAAQRNSVFPASFLELLDRLGIDPHKEGEAFMNGPVEDGCHLYGGWFYFVGEMVIAGENANICTDHHSFGYFFTRTHPPHRDFAEGPMLGLEFEAHVPWVLAEDPESGWTKTIKA
jgi:hypothetical protein